MNDQFVKVYTFNNEDYWIVPQPLLEDKNLRLGTKAIYAYLRTCAGKSPTVTKRRAEIRDELNITISVLDKNLKILESTGYLTIEKIDRNYLKITFNK